MIVDWTTFKGFVDTRSLSIQYVLIGDKYWLKAFDGPFFLETTIHKKTTADDPSDQKDFEDNYQPAGNVSYTDGDNASLIRNKMAPKGWNYHVRGMEFETSKLNSLENNDATGTDMGGVTQKFYDVNDVELTTQGSIDTDCVKSQVDYEPIYDYEILGGWLSMPTTTTENIRIYAIGAPDIPANLGGSKSMICNLNARYMKENDRLRIDGRTSKRMPYDATYHTGKLRLIFKHAAGIKCEFELVLEQYRP